MATTSLWRVHGWLGKVVLYVENPDKTDNPKYYEKQDMTEHEAQGLADVIEYAVNIRKTANRTQNQTQDEASPLMRQFVSGVNVSPTIARETMMNTQREFEKTNGVVAYHGYQSFSPGDRQAAGGRLTPEMAHEIGVKLAKQLWGDKYQVLVATHLDKANHLHNHFVINTVSHVDGKKFHRTNRDYYNMQRESDALCREYGLSVIEDKGRAQTKHYAEWQADSKGEPTYHSIIKADVDKAIRQSMTERQFWDNLKKMGYHVKFGQDITLRPEGRSRGLKLMRNFGDDYTIEAIRRRILAQARPERPRAPPEPARKTMRFRGTFHRVRKATGLRALYFYYLYRMGVLPKKQEPNPRRVYFLFREDIRHMQNIARETRLLVKHGIDTDVQLAAHKGGVTAQIATLSSQRKRLSNKTRTVKGEDALAALKSEIAALSAQIGELRREVRLCENIETRSVEMKDKLHRAREDAKSKSKEMTRHEPFRRRR